MTFLQVKNQIRSSDVTGAFDSIMNLLPVGMKIIGFVLLLTLIIRAARTYKSMSVTDMAAIVIAFALVSR